MRPEITRRAFVSGIAGVGLLSESVAAAQVASPGASPTAHEATTIHVAHFCRLTTQVPESWKHSRLGYDDGLIGSNGFLLTTASTANTLEGALEGFVLSLGLPQRPVSTSFT